MSRPPADRGQVTAFVVFLAFALILCAGLVVDGGHLSAATRDARNAAASAARAGAQALDVRAFRVDDARALDPRTATTKAATYLAAAGYQGSVAIKDDTVTVTVTIHVPMLLLNVVGVPPRTVTVTEAARIQSGP